MAPSPEGQDPGEAKTGPSLGTATVTLSSPQKSTESPLGVGTRVNYPNGEKIMAKLEDSVIDRGLNAVIDISHYNGPDIDFKKVAETGIIGVIGKATQGQAGVDKLYSDNKKKALDAGLLWGAYHFGTGSDGVLQAAHFLETVGDTKDTLLVLDFEHNPTGPSMNLTEARAFVTHINEATGRFPGFYSGNDIKEELGPLSDQVLVLAGTIFMDSCRAIKLGDMDSLAIYRW
jgi:GH25 family lysozyme M1 (1,4-beta-N-acetylmuramidase)